MLCWKLGEPKSGVTLEAAVVVAVVMVVVQRLAVPLVHAFGGLVRNTSDSARFFTWCITPKQNKSNKTAVLGVMHYCNQIYIFAGMLETTFCFSVILPQLVRFDSFK